MLNTHGHIDHICAIDAVSEVYPVPLAIHLADVPMYTDERFATMFGRKTLLVFPGYGEPATIEEEKYEKPFVTVEKGFSSMVAVGDSIEDFEK